MKVKRLNQLIFLILLLIGSATLRVYLFHGVGLGDDPNYVNAVNTISRESRVSYWEHAYYHRIMFWFPLLLSTRIFGMSEYSIIAPILFFELGIILMVYLLAKKSFDDKTAMYSALFCAINPFNVAFSTSLVIDFIQSFFFCTSLYFFLRTNGKEGQISSILAALSILSAYYVSPKGIYILSVFLPYSLYRLVKRQSNIKNESFFYMVLIILFSGLFLWDYAVYGNFLKYIQAEKNITVFFPLTKGNLLAYPRLMFTNSDFGYSLFGIHFWLFTPILIYLIFDFKKWEKTLPYILSSVLLFLLLALAPVGLLSGKINLDEYFHFLSFRYLAVMLPASFILMGHAFIRIHKKAKDIATLILFIYLLTSLTYAVSLASFTHDSNSDVRFVREKAVGLDPVLPVYADQFITWQLAIFVNQNEHPREFILKNNWLDLKNIKTGYVVTGGARNQLYGCKSCILEVGDHKVPPNWVMIAKNDLPLNDYRTEPLRIWQIK